MTTADGAEELRPSVGVGRAMDPAEVDALLAAVPLPALLVEVASLVQQLDGLARPLPRDQRLAAAGLADADDATAGWGLFAYALLAPHLDAAGRARGRHLVGTAGHVPPGVPRLLDVARRALALAPPVQAPAPLARPAVRRAVWAAALALAEDRPDADARALARQRRAAATDLDRPFVASLASWAAHGGAAGDGPDGPVGDHIAFATTTAELLRFSAAAVRLSAGQLAHAGEAFRAWVEARSTDVAQARESARADLAAPAGRAPGTFRDHPVLRLPDGSALVVELEALAESGSAEGTRRATGHPARAFAGLAERVPADWALVAWPEALDVLARGDLDAYRHGWATRLAEASRPADGATPRALVTSVGLDLGDQAPAPAEGLPPVLGPDELVAVVARGEQAGVGPGEQLAAEVAAARPGAPAPQVGVLPAGSALVQRWERWRSGRLGADKLTSWILATYGVDVVTEGASVHGRTYVRKLSAALEG